MNMNSVPCLIKLNQFVAKPIFDEAELVRAFRLPIKSDLTFVGSSDCFVSWHYLFSVMLKSFAQNFALLRGNRYHLLSRKFRQRNYFRPVRTTIKQ